MLRHQRSVAGRIVLLTLLLASALAALPARAATLDTTADRVLGQPNFTTNGFGATATTLSSVYDVAIDKRGGRVFAADYINSRVLSWPSASGFSNGQAADLVFGQADFTSVQANRGAAVSAQTLAFPSGVAVNGLGNLYVADNNNSRVLRYRPPFSSGMAAAQVFGQRDDFTTNTPNIGGTSTTSLAYPLGLDVDLADNLYVADPENHRVLAYTTPTNSDTTADMVFGQAGDFTTNTPNNGGLSADSLFYPDDVAIDGVGNLYIADTYNQRVLFYATPRTTDTIADRVFGQAGSFTINTVNNGGLSGSSFSSPIALTVDSAGNLYVADFSNNRVLQFSTPSTSDTNADGVFGQAGSFATNTSNTGGISADSMNRPIGLALDAAQNLYIADWNNNRVLGFDQPLANGIATVTSLGPSTVPAGSPAFVLTVNGSGFVGGSEVRWGGSARPSTFINSTRLTAQIAAADVAAGGPFAVTVFTPGPGGGASALVNFPLAARAALDTTADRVLGQPNFVATDLNNPTIGGVQVGGVSANSFYYPFDVAVDSASGRVFVADNRNNRVLSWPSAAAWTNAQAADLVLGQPDFTSIQRNQGGTEPTAATLNGPVSMAVDAIGSLYVSDHRNNRVLRFAAPLTSGMAASKVYGQSDSFTTNTENNGGISANSLIYVQGLALDAADNLYVADVYNSRVLVFRAAATGDTTADLVFGQGGNFTTNTLNNGGLSADSLFYPYSVALDATGSVYIADTFNNRVLRFDAPLTSDTTADAVFGQAGSFTTETINNHGLSATSLAAPCDVMLDALGNLYIADTGNHRVLEYDTPRTNTTADRVFGQNGSFTSAALGGGTDGLFDPFGLTLDVNRNLYIADTDNSRVLAFDTPIANRVPTLVGTAPITAAIGSGALTLTITGTGFVSGTVVRWDSTDLATTVVSATQLTALVPATLLTTAGTASVTVFNPAPGGGASGATPFTITAATSGRRVLLPLIQR